MKSILIVLVSMAFSFQAWGNHHNGMKEDSKNATVYSVDTKESSITWKGGKKFVDSYHTGTLNLSSGQIVYKNNKPVRGEIVVDMASIKNTDLPEEEDKQKLVGHLKSKDFFSVNEHKVAKFMFDKVEELGKNKYAFKGNLEIRGVKKPKTIKATLNNKGEKLMTDLELNIDRTEYGVEYNAEGSQGNFITRMWKGGKDKVIKNNMEVNVKLVAKKNKKG